MAGRKPKPTALKVVQGNAGKRKLNKSEPKPPQSKPKCPEWMKGVARRAFYELADELDMMKVITLADRKALELLCQTYAEWRQAVKKLDDHGSLTYESRNLQGGIMIRTRPEVSIRNDAARRLISLLGEFGLTPASRSRVNVSALPDDDPFESFQRADRE